MYNPYQSVPDDTTNIARLLERCPAEQRLSCIRLDPGDPFGNCARRVECAVFTEFFGNTPDVMLEAYGPYEAASSFLVVVDRDKQRLAGALRIVPGGGKTLADVTLPPLCLTVSDVVTRHSLQLECCWDIATLAVPKDYRRSGIAMMLYTRLYVEAMTAGIPHGLAILDDHAYQQLVSLGVSVEPICDSEPFEYMGSAKNRATVIHVASSTLQPVVPPTTASAPSARLSPAP